MNKMLMANIEAAFPGLTTKKHIEILNKLNSNMLFKVSLCVGIKENEGMRFPSNLEIMFYNFTKGILLTVTSKNGESWNAYVKEESCLEEHRFVLFGNTALNKHYRLGIEISDVGDIVRRLSEL